jgi:hypothetical protein
LFKESSSIAAIINFFAIPVDRKNTFQLYSFETPGFSGSLMKLNKIIIKQFPIGPLQVFTYLVACSRAKEAVLIDPAIPRALSVSL